MLYMQHLEAHLGHHVRALQYQVCMHDDKMWAGYMETSFCIKTQGSISAGFPHFQKELSGAMLAALQGRGSLCKGWQTHVCMYDTWLHLFWDTLRTM